MDNIQLCYIDNEINKIDKMKQGDVIYKNGVELLVVLMGYPLMWTTLPFLTGNGEKNQ